MALTLASDTWISESPSLHSHPEDNLTSKLYGWLAGFLAILTVVGVIYGKGRLDAAHKAEMETVRQDLAVATETIRVEKEARREDAILATENSKRQAALNLKITGLEDYVETLQDRNRECLSGADADRLRDLWQSP